MVKGPVEHVNNPYGHSKEFVHGDETISPERSTGFSSPFFTTCLFSIVAFYALYRVDNYYNGDKKIHPIGAFFYGFREDQEKAAEYYYNWLKTYKIVAEDTLVLKDYVKNDPTQMIRVKNTAGFHRRSDWLVGPGESVDFSDVKVKHSWQEDDKLFGVPYPKGESQE